MDLFSGEVVQNSPCENIGDIAESILKKVKNKHNFFGASTGFKALDDFAGFAKHHIYILAARPSMGKTNVALNLALNQVKQGKKVLFVDLEGQKEQNTIRLLNILTETNLKYLIKNKNLTDNQRNELITKIKEGSQKLTKDKIIYCEKASLTISEIKDIAKQYKDIDLIIIDHLTKIKSSLKSGGNRYEHVTDVANSLRGLVADLNGTPLLVLAQINRGTEDKKDKRPSCADLKGSGEIEENADVVMLLYREGYYDKANAKSTDILEVIYDKNRHGECGIAKLIWEGHIQRIRDVIK